MGERIRRAREEAGMTQTELAELAKFSQAAISKIEQGKRDVPAAEILYLCISLDKPILYFYQGDLIPEDQEIYLSPLESDLLANANKIDY